MNYPSLKQILQARFRPTQVKIFIILPYIYIYIYIYIQHISLINRLQIAYIFNIYMYVRQHISHTSLLTFSIRMRISSRVKLSPHNAAVLPPTRSIIFCPLQPFIAFR
ncbi:hypothetical protein GIB67_015720 [Kingdonia uniflora]|uniref:Uncharacterized protein n=1 Tax=Kingdonia uniflora TaxID=39325 RepID=A0A7J7NV30_9MAGN|nr:hypothetical protein GIB67_015720 [Kingdonia uniflora]